MKKILIIILSILLFCAFIAGCNKNESSTDLGASSTISENSFESSFVDSFEDSSIDSSENTSEDSSKNTSEDSSIDSSNDSSISEDITVEYELELLTNLYNIKVEECIILDLLFKANGENADWSLLTFTSSNPSVATVDKEGLITGINQGNATITIEMEGKLLTATVTVTSIQEITAEQVNTFDEEYVNIFGRSYITNNKLNLDHGASAVELGIFGTSLKINLKTSANSYMRVWVDGVEEPDRIKIIPSVTNYTIVNNLENTYHQIRIIKATEMNEATWEILSFEAEKFMTVPEKPALKLEFVGDSISAGYGSLGKNGDRYSVDNSDSTRTYAILTANKLNADYSVVACSGICAKAYHWQKSINMNTLYTYTSYKNQSNYQFDFQPDVIVLNLGTNEGSYLSPSYGGSSYAQLFPADYKEMLTTIRSNNPSAYIICLY
ncbi:MAG: Ig-like domain-containing protein, partial [Clostridia bacterium]|nr:Ig-like domain-containing protein [Clostridia bacterium]